MRTAERVPQFEVPQQHSRNTKCQATKARLTNQNNAANVFPAEHNSMHPGARAQGHSTTKKRLLIAAVILFSLVVVAGIIAHQYWPFTESCVLKNLSSASSATVRFGSFHQKYFPLGCVAENVIFERGNSAQPLMTIRKLIIRDYPAAMLHKHVSIIRAEGLHVMLPGSGATTNDSESQHRIIDRLVADDAVLEVQRTPQQTLRFVFHKFAVKNLGGAGPISFSAVFDNPMPAGLIRTSGEFGPWSRASADQTPISGKYSLETADLSVFKGIGGMLSSKGEFKGTFKQLNVEGSTKSPAFEVTKTHHALPLETHFTATVNAFKGDVVLNQVKGRYGRNDLIAHGTIGRENKKRVARVEIRCDHGRIEDVFYPFIHSPKSPLTGDVSFTMNVIIPSGHEPFVRKIDLRSNFQIQNAVFTHAQTQHRLDKIAESPGQKDPTQTLSDFQGTVQLADGVAHFSSLSIHDQGAAATFHGNYSLTDERVDMYGNLKTAASLAKTTHGISAVFAKVLEPFFKKKPHETVVPVKIGGTYSHPNFGLNM